MNNFFNKILLIGSALVLSTSIANAENTVCYKNNWDSPSTIETTVLDGGECKGKYSIYNMKEMGWRILDIKINPNKKNLDYQYLLTKDQIVNKAEKIEEVKEIKNTISNSKKRLSYKAFGTKITNLENNKTIIDIGNLIIGQSGVVIHLYDNDKRLIVSNAKVISSTNKTSTVEFFDFNDLKQDALPTANRTVEKGDILALNYLYTYSLLIAPNQEAFQTVRNKFKYNTFVHSDIFGVELKNNEEPMPTKESIQKFAISQNLGTVFVLADNKINVIDTKTFKILTSYPMNYNEKYQLPFYTRIEKIEAGPFNSIKNFSLKDLVFSSEEDTSGYENYYKKLLGL